MRICVIADTFSPPYDEGFKKISYRLAHEFSQQHDVLALSMGQADVPFRHAGFRSNRAFLSLDLWRRLAAFGPDVVFYVPFSSFTRNAFVRAQVLRLYAPNAALALVGVQAREWAGWEEPLIRACRPDVVLTPLPDAIARLRRLGISAEFLPFGVDLQRFRPLFSASKRAVLKKRLGLNPTVRVYLHVGQLTEKRNVSLLRHLQGPGSQVVVVGSSSSEAQGFPHSRRVVGELEEAGAKVWIRYFEHIQELYQVADCYVFPTFHETGGIGFPLSVVEALACGTRVVSTPFGGLPEQLPPCEALHYASSDDELLSLARSGKGGGSRKAAALVQRLGWPSIARRALANTLKSLPVQPSPLS